MFACAGCGGLWLLNANAFLPSWFLLMAIWLAADSAIRPAGKLSPLDALIALVTLVIAAAMSRWPLVIVTIIWWSVYFIRTWRRVGKKEWLPWEKKLARLDHLTCLAMVLSLAYYEGVGYHTIWWLKNL